MNWNANLELQHIYLEVQAERFHHLRTFMEAYFCFQHNYVTSKGHSDWQKMLPDLPHSQAATCLSESKREWWIPCPVIIGLLKALLRDECANIENIQAVLDHYVGFVLISEDEQKTLKQRGLQSAMPASFYQENSTEFQCALSRFRAVNIEFSSCIPTVSVVPYPQERKEV